MPELPSTGVDTPIQLGFYKGEEKGMAALSLSPAAHAWTLWEKELS